MVRAIPTPRRHLLILLILLLLTACASSATPETSDSPEEPVAEAPAPEEEEAPAPEPEEEPTPEPEPEEEPPSSDAEPLVVLIDNDEGPITPVNYNTFIGFWMLGWVYDPLYVRAPDLSAVPALATDATVSEDGLTWEVTLRDDVTWHDGEPFTSEDVVFSYQFLIDSGRAPNLAAVDTVEANGEHAVTINLSQPAPFFQSEGLAGYYILPAHIWGEVEVVTDELNQFEGRTGTGPFRLVDIVPGESYTFEANQDYYRGPPAVPLLIAKIVKDRTQQFNQLRSGEADAVLSSVPPAQVEQLASSEEIALAQGSDFFNYIFYLNGSRPPLDNLALREAVALAIDTETLVDVVLLGQGVELPLSWYHPDLPWATGIPNEYDPGRAQELLEEAGFVDSDGDGIREADGEPMSYEILCDTNNTVEIRATELIAEWLGDIGIEATQNCIDIDTSVAMIWPNFVAVPDPDYDMAIWGWSSTPQFQQGFLRGLLDGDFGGVGWGNLTGIADPVLDEMTAEYISSTDPARTEELAVEIQERIAEQLPWVSLMSPGGNFAYRPDAYDDWVYVRGTGIMTFWSFMPESARP